MPVIEGIVVAAENENVIVEVCVIVRLALSYPIRACATPLPTHPTVPVSVCD